MYEFVDTCLTAKVDKCFLSERKNWIKQLLREKETFQVTDLGAGAKKLSKIRSVAQLIKNSSSKGLYGLILWKIARHYKPSLMLELGTSIGTGSIHLKNGYPESHLITVEGCDQTLRKAQEQFSKWNLSYITNINSSFEDFLDIPSIGKYNLIFIDGNHQSKATLSYIDKLLPYTHSETIIILDDIRWNEDMWAMWCNITHDNRFHLTIDLGRMGIIWRKESQEKEHFIIRPWILKTKIF